MKALSVLARRTADALRDLVPIISSSRSSSSEMQARYAVRLLVWVGVSRAVVVDHERNPVGIATLRNLVLGHVEE